MRKPNIEDILINPFYAITISLSLFAEHEPLATKKLWVKANAKLMDKIGKEEWLKELLNVLESGGPRTVSEKHSI